VIPLAALERGEQLDKPKRRPKRDGLFDGYCVENGKRRRLTRAELAECYRLWAKHADIRTGKAL
jgi:hypothetical protein